MEAELERILINLKDAGCGKTAQQTAEQIWRTGDTATLTRYLRKCRCDLMEDLHERQRRVDRMDYLLSTLRT